jgi:Neuraminidase (sialidase)
LGTGPADLRPGPGQPDHRQPDRVTADGTLVDGFNLIVNFKNAHKVRGEHVAVLRSADKGVSWDSQATLVDDLDEIGVTDPTTGAAVRTGDIIPEIAVAPGTNTVYMVWQDARSTGGARDQIAFARSTDAGRTWRTVSLAINAVHTTQAFNPQIRVLPDGTIGVLYNDFRSDDAGAPLVTSTWLAHSHDGGQTWTETKVGGNYDMTRAPVARGFFLGDYDALGAAGTTFTPIFPQTTGTSGPAADNIYAATVTPSA